MAISEINLNINRRGAYVDSFFNKMHGFKKSYGRINNFLRFGEVLVPPTAVSLFSQPKKILKEQQSLFTIPGFVGSTLRFSNTISELHSSPLSKTERVKKSILPTLRYVQSCSTLLQYISTIRLVDLKKISQPLSAINAIARMVLSVSAFYTQIQRLDRSFESTRKEGFLFFNNLLNLYSALLCFITFFFSLSTSPSWMLAVSTLLLVSTLVDNMLKFVLD